MANKRLSMRKLHEVLRLKFELKLSRRKIATTCGIARSTVADYLIRFEVAGLNWPEAAVLDVVDGLKAGLFAAAQHWRPEVTTSSRGRYPVNVSTR